MKPSFSTFCDFGVPYTFTAPSTGLYGFLWNCKTSRKKRFITGLVVNGDWKVGNYLVGDYLEANAASQTYIVQLNEGDEVGIQTYEDETYMGGEKISAFAGFKL